MTDQQVGSLTKREKNAQEANRRVPPVDDLRSDLMGLLANGLALRSRWALSSALTALLLDGVGGELVIQIPDATTGSPEISWTVPLGGRR